MTKGNQKPVRGGTTRTIAETTFFLGSRLFARLIFRLDERQSLALKGPFNTLETKLAISFLRGGRQPGRRTGLGASASGCNTRQTLLMRPTSTTFPLNFD